MLSTPHKRFIWARTERFADFSDFSFFHVLVKRRRPPPEPRVRVKAEPMAVGNKRWKPSAWTPWLWMK